MFDISEIWTPKFRIGPKMPVSTYGSCFAQHFGRALRDRGFFWQRTEKRPFGLSGDNLARFGFDVFSSRTGNIYTTTLLRQWLHWALEDREVPDEVWEQNGRFFDPFRPVAEPDGFASREELLIARAQTLDAFRRSVTDANVFVFTLGLTERWLNRAGYEYPMCPGTAAGNFDETAHVFDNLDFARAREALAESIAMMRRSNPNLKFILTVSPVPLTATYSGKNVLVATMQSKSVLRAVAGQLADRAQYIDYFPSYEIINSPVYKGAFFEPNMRSVTAHGVGFVMDTFFASQKAAFGVAPTGVPDSGPSAEQIVCEEELLEKFGAAK